jgi:hypothetical protein
VLGILALGVLGSWLTRAEPTREATPADR